jgi:hypothetical protein
MALVAVLALPALQVSRESSRKQLCRDRIARIGLALHAYHDAHATFPPGFVLGENGTYHGWGWSAMAAGTMQIKGFVAPDFDRGLTSDAAQFLPEFRCPSDLSSSRLEQATLVTGGVTDWRVATATARADKVFPRSNYFGMASFLKSEAGGITLDAPGVPPASGPHVNNASLGNFGTESDAAHHYCDTNNFFGVFGQNSRTRINDIVDGVSNVSMVGERYAPADDTAGTIGHGTWLGTSDCSTASGLSMILGDASLPINTGWASKTATTGYGSLHDQGAFFLIADGSVRFLSNKMDLPAYRKLSDYSDGYRYWEGSF